MEETSAQTNNNIEFGSDNPISETNNNSLNQLSNINLKDCKRYMVITKNKLNNEFNSCVQTFDLLSFESVCEPGKHQQYLIDTYPDYKYYFYLFVGENNKYFCCTTNFAPVELFEVVNLGQNDNDYNNNNNN